MSELVEKEFQKYTFDKMCSNKTEYKKVCCDTELITEPFDESKRKQQNVSDICPVGTILPWMNRIKSPSGQFLIRKLEFFVLKLWFY